MLPKGVNLGYNHISFKNGFDMSGTKFFLALVLMLSAGTAQARVYKCVQGETTVFSQEPCAGDMQVIEAHQLRANSLPPPEPRTKKVLKNKTERTTAHPVYSSLARSRLMNLQVEIERWLRSSAEKAERERLLREIARYEPKLEQIRQQVKNATALSVELDSEEAQLRREHRTERAKLARLLFEHEKQRNTKLYNLAP